MVWGMIITQLAFGDLEVETTYRATRNVRQRKPYYVVVTARDTDTATVETRDSDAATLLTTERLALQDPIWIIDADPYDGSGNEGTVGPLGIGAALIGSTFIIG